MQAVDTSYWKEYGNNYFKLAFCLDGNNAVEADGVLTEVPSISMSTDWEESPAAAIGSFMSETLNNDLVEFLGQSSSSYKRQVSMDRFTSRTFKDTSPLSFDLKFRVYTGQKIGTKTMTSAKKWIACLAATTPVHSGNGYDLNNTINNLGAAVEGLKAIFEEAGKEASDDDLEKQGISKDDSPAQIMQKTKANIDGKKSFIDTEQDHGFLGFGGKSKEENQAAANKAAALDVINSSFNTERIRAGEGDENRLMDSHRWGANLFQLRIMPFIFLKPLVVYISDWSVTPSREYNESTKDSFYYDFTISCKQDRKLSAQKWQEIIGK